MPERCPIAELRETMNENKELIARGRNHGGSWKNQNADGSLFSPSNQPPDEVNQLATPDKREHEHDHRPDQKARHEFVLHHGNALPAVALPRPTPEIYAGSAEDKAGLLLPCYRHRAVSRTPVEREVLSRCVLERTRFQRSRRARCRRSARPVR